jgi:hypothetical protein
MIINDTFTAYASNEMYISVCNNLNNTNSNINIGTLGGDLKAYADFSSNTYLTMELYWQIM